jgi:hypothetical protein
LFIFHLTNIFLLGNVYIWKLSYLGMYTLYIFPTIIVGWNGHYIIKGFKTVTIILYFYIYVFFSQNSHSTYTLAGFNLTTHRVFIGGRRRRHHNNSYSFLKHKYKLRGARIKIRPKISDDDQMFNCDCLGAYIYNPPQYISIKI